MRRDLTATGLIALTLLAILPAYQRVFADDAWRAPAITAALLALGLAVTSRRLGRSSAVTTLVSGVALLASLPWLVGVRDRPVLPRPSTIELLGELSRQASVELALTPAPAPSLTGLILAVTAGVWAVSHLAHELLVRQRRPGWALIPLTVLWAAPLVVPMAGDRTWPNALPFLAAAGFVLLVTASDGGEGDPTASPVSSAGLAMGAVVIAIAAVAPGLLPGYGAGSWAALGAGSQPRGLQPIVDIANRLQLPEERDVLRVRASQRTYLRLAGLDSFDGFTWRLGDSDGSYRVDPDSLYAADDVLPPEQAAARVESIYVDVEVLELENIFVPIPYQPIEILGPQRDQMVWSTEGGFLATWDRLDDTTADGARVGVRQGVTYRVEAARPAPSFDDLAAVEVPDEVRERWTRLPREYPQLREQAEDIYAAAGATSMVEQALALQEWFTGPDGGFTYDLDVPALRGDEALEAFVVEDRVGYCEYFATAMAVMLRETGIPARVAVGFLPGRVTRPADPADGRELTEYLVSTADAHAWVEVLFPGSGWITFEPTPRSDRSQVVPTADDLAPTESLLERQARERAEQREGGSNDDLLNDFPGLRDGDERSPLEDVEAAPPGSAGGSSELLARWPVTVVLPLGAVLAAGVVARRRRRSRAGVGSPVPSERILAAQRRLLTVASSYGIGRRPEETTREVIERWQREQRIDDRGSRFARAAQAAAFGGTVDADLADEVDAMVAELEALLRASVDRRDRLAAPVRIPAAAVAARTKRVLTTVARR